MFSYALQSLVNGNYAMGDFLRAFCLTLVAVLATACNEKGLAPDVFTDRFLSELHEAAPDSEFQKTGELTLEGKGSDGKELKIYLDNAYLKYQQEPQSLDQIMSDHISSLLESWSADFSKVDPTRIVPVIKDKNYIADVQQSMAEKGGSADDWDVPANEDYNGELVILYAEDSERNIRYLSDEKLAEIGVSRDGLRAKAVENLRPLLPDIEIHGDAGTYMLTAGGNYEASLILFDEIWREGQLSVKGETVIAVPSRDVLVVTGSEDAAGVEELKRIVTEILANGIYSLSDRLFVYRDGKFVPFEG